MKFGLAICVCLFLALISQKHEDYFLDLTKVKLPVRKELVITDGGGSSASNDTRFPKLSLEISLLSLDKSKYQMGEEMVYDIAIKNVGQDPVIIPWSPDRYQVRPDETYPSGYMSAILSLVVNDYILGEHIFYGPSLYGSSNLKSSLKELPPGQTVRIRAPSRWTLMSGHELFISRLPQTFDVRARFNITWNVPSPSPQPLVSTNSITTQLTRQKE